MAVLNDTMSLSPEKYAVAHPLAEIGARDKRICCLTSDVFKTIRLDEFAEACPERMFNVGIAEQETMSVAAGLATEGFIPYVYSFAAFLTMRSCEQIRSNVCYPNLPVRLIGTYGGYANSISGATHCGLEDMGLMCSMGNMTVCEPSDPVTLEKTVRESVDWKGPLYMRADKEVTEKIYSDDVEFKIGKALIPREGNDGAFICAGIIVRYALEAAEILQKEQGVNIRVVDMHTIKPIDEDAVKNAVETGRVVVAQDGNIIGGLGDRVAAVMAQNGLCCKYRVLGAPDTYVPLATTAYVRHKNSYDVEGLVKVMASLL